MADVHLKSAYFPGSSNKQQIHLYANYSITSDTASSKVIKVGMYIYSTGSGWDFGPWGQQDSGSYISCTNVISGDSTYYTKTDVPNTTTTAHWIFKDKTFTVGPQVSSVSIGWKLACNPSSWLGDSSWNRPSGSFTINLTPYYSSCGAPSSLSVKDNGNNTVTVSCKVGSNGTHNNASGVDIYVTYNGTAPSTGSYHHTSYLTGSAGATVSKTLDFSSTADSTMSGYLGTDYKGPIKFTARTRGAAGSSYYSGVATAASADLTWYSSPSRPTMTVPGSGGASSIARDAYTISWSASSAGRNNAVASYSIRIRNTTTATDVSTVTAAASATSYTFGAGYFVGGNTYKFYIKAVGTKSSYSSAEYESGALTVIAATGLPNFSLRVSSDNFTVPRTSIYGTEAFVNIGSGTLTKFNWDDPAVDDISDVSGYAITITHPDLGYEMWHEELGKTNEFALRGDMLLVNLAPWERTKLDTFLVTITAQSKYGAEFNSYASTSIAVTYGSGMYLDVTEPTSGISIAKRAIAFMKITNTSGQEQWVLANAGYFKDASSGQWKQGDIAYEILLDANGEIIYDSNNSPIYTL